MGPPPVDPPGVEPGSTALSERRPRPVGLRSMKRTVRESNPHGLATITGFEPDKHAYATVRVLRVWAGGFEPP